MLMEDYLNLKDIFALDVLWELLPSRIPGRVSYKFPGGNTGKIEPLIEINYPDGKPMRDLYSTELGELSIGDKVIFQLRDAREDKKREKQQPNLKDACNVEFALDEHIANLSYEFNPAKIASLGRALSAAIEDVTDKQMNMDQEIEQRLADQLRTRVQALDEQKKSLEEQLNQLEVRKVELSEREQLLDQFIAEQVAEKKLELEQFKAELDLKAEKIEKDNKALKKRQQELNADTAQLANSMAKFREEGGEKFIEYIKTLEAPDDLLQEMVPLPDKELPKHFFDGVNTKLSRDNFRVAPTVSAEFLLSTLTAANTGQFVVLSGPTGVGKTSMVSAFAAALGAGYGVVPVRPSWIDPTDLLGFYNPQTHRYQASPFMDCFLDAKRYSEANRLYFLTLDEMNLARVENYAADFLSRLEKAHTGERNACISLYSKDVEQSLAVDTNQPDLKILADIAVHRSKYPASLKIPEGLVMFGTINLDETTHHLSPKFLDRSFVVKVPAQELVTQIVDLDDVISQMKVYFDLSLNTARELAKKPSKPHADIQEIWDDVLHWQVEYIQPLGINLGFRFSQTYLMFMNIALRLDLAPRAAASAFFKSKLFPWISFHQDDHAIGNADQRKADVLESWTEDDAWAAYPEDYGLRNALQATLNRGANSVVVQYLE